MSSSLFFIALSLFMAVTVGVSYGQTNSSSITGNVQDGTGALVPNASVTALQAEEHQEYHTVSDRRGHYSFPSVIAGTYTITIDAKGFEKNVQTSLVVDASTTVSVGDTSLTVGADTMTVTVSAEGEHLQTENAEKVENVTNAELRDLPIDSGSSNGRSYIGALATVPGSQSFEPSGQNITINGSASGQVNLTLDGILNVDPGSNTTSQVDINADNVGEMHITTSNSGADYGREQNTIAVTTASGTSKYHGEFAWFHRHEDLNANSWANKRTPTLTPRSRARLNEFSGNFSGPVIIPHVWESLRDKLFFFVGEDFQSPLLAEANKDVNLPTYAESKGDFSQSVNKNGTAIYLTDYTAPGTGSCNSSNTVANPGRCFVGISTFTGQPSINVIPSGRQSALGQSIVGVFANYIPAAGYLGYPSAGKYAQYGQALTTPQKGYNYVDGDADSETYRQDIYRVDYNPTPTLQTHVRWANLVEQVSTFYGAIYSDTTNLPTTEFLRNTPGHGIAIGATKIFNKSTTNEATAGFNVSKLHNAPTTNALTPAGTGITGYPTLFAPQTAQIPDFEFAGNNLANSPQLNVNDIQYRNQLTNQDYIDNFTKILGRHQVQLGAQYERVRKDQYLPGAVGGLYQFGDDVNNPLDTSDAYANAITGVFDTFNQQSVWPEGKYRYGSFDFYAQDTVRVTPRLTIVAGLRMQHWSPWYNKTNNSVNFNPSLYNLPSAPRLYLPTATGSVDPGTGTTEPKAYAGLLVPGSGNYDDGIIAQPGAQLTNNLGGMVPTAGSKVLYSSKEWLPAPHLGLTYDLFSNHKTVFRAGGGTYYDRFNANPTINLLNNPPVVQNPTVYYGTFTSLESAPGLLGPSALNAIATSHFISPVTYQFNVDIQQQLPYRAILTVGYVGNRSSHLLQALNLNWVPYGAAFLPQNQNPAGTSTIPGGNAYAQTEINRYKGFGNITNEESVASDNYNGLQITGSRKYAHGVYVSATYVFSKTLGVSGIDNLGRTRELYYNPASTDRRQTFQTIYSYTIPSFFHNAWAHGAIDGWEISGISTFFSGTPFSITQTVYQPGTTTTLASQNLDGSYTEAARVTLVANPFVGANKNGPYGRLNPAAFQASPQGSLAAPYLGQGMRSDSFYGPGLLNTDLSLVKHIALKSDRVKLELRADAFNVANHVNYSGFNTTETFSGGPSTIGSTSTAANVASPTNTGGFGGVSGAQPNRVMALLARISF